MGFKKCLESLLFFKFFCDLFRVFFTALEALLRKSDLQTCFVCPRIDIFFDGHDVFLLEVIIIIIS